MTHSSRTDALAQRIDALIHDARGAFRPRTVLLGGSGDPRLVTLVGLDDDGRVQLLTPEPLRDGPSYTVEPLAGDAPLPAGPYVLDSLRVGQRPQDVQPIWICTLIPAKPSRAEPR